MVESVLIYAIVGYLFLSRVYKYKSEINRDSGYHVLFKSVLYGTVIYVPVYIAIVTLYGNQDQSELVQSALPSNQNQSELVQLALKTSPVLVCMVLIFIVNLFLNKERWEIESAMEHGDYLGILMRECVSRQKFIEVTLKDRKVYVGVPFDFPGYSTNASSKEQFITILPVKSGYREQNELRVVFTTDYDWIVSGKFENFLNGLDLEDKDFAVVISRSEVLSARIYDEEVRDQFYKIYRGDVSY